MSETFPQLVPLAWDSGHFHFPVARIEGNANSPESLSRLLTAARAAGVRLVYWNGPTGTNLPDELLSRFSGTLVDRKVTLTRSLGGEEHPPPTNRAIQSWPRGPASDALVRLAIASGERSRFRVDSRFPEAIFESMYQQWIQRSARGEIADAVLVALEPTDQQPLGLITVTVKESVGHIGLLAVDGKARGCGLGTALLAASHAFMAARGCTGASVVTQGDNEPALRLYGRAGYHRSALTNVYHFWPLNN